MTLFRRQDDESQQQEDLADHCRQVDPVGRVDILAELVRVRPVFQRTGKATREVWAEGAAESAALEASLVGVIVQIEKGLRTGSVWKGKGHNVTVDRHCRWSRNPEIRAWSDRAPVRVDRALERSVAGPADLLQVRNADCRGVSESTRHRGVWTIT